MDFFKGFLTDYTLNELILNLVSGYIFVYIFCFVTSIQKPSLHTSNIFVPFFIGYILTIFFHVCPSITGNNIYIDTVLFLILCIICAYVSARFYDSKIFVKLCISLKINKTPHEYIWSDIVKQRKSILWVRCKFISLDLEVIGQFNLGEDYQRYPIIVLSCYEKICISSGETVESYVNSEHNTILVDTSKADTIEFIYSDENE